MIPEEQATTGDGRRVNMATFAKQMMQNLFLGHGERAAADSSSSVQVQRKGESLVPPAADHIIQGEGDWKTKGGDSHRGLKSVTWNK